MGGKKMNQLTRIALKTAGIGVGTLFVLFNIYFWNLDMKLMRSVIVPFLQNYHDNKEHDRLI